MSSVIISGDTSGSVTLQAPATAGSTTLTLPAVSGTVLQSGTTVTEAQGGTGTTVGYYGFKNRIINGAMTIAQRGTSAFNLASTPFSVDRFAAAITTAIFTGKGTIGQSTVAPTGFTNSLLWTQTTGVTPSASQIGTIYQGIEGGNIADLGFGTANATQVTLSFWVRSSVVGTYCVGLRNGSTDRSYVAEYSISSANTWEYKTITIAGDTSGTWATDNTAGIYITWDLGSGSDSNTTAGSWAAGNFRRTTNQVSFVGNSGATFYITGVQLEKGSTATSFDYRPYGTELALCQRYYYKESVPNTSIFGCSLYAASSTGSRATGRFPVTLRAAPTALEQTGTAANYNVNIAGTSRVSSAVPLFNSASTNAWFVTLTVASGQTAGQAGVFGSLSDDCYLAWSAEL